MKKLKSYIRKHGLKVSYISGALRVSEQTVYEWLKETRCPSLKHAIRIEKMTNGAVTVYDFA